jgi:phosphatidylglycerol:prolipoprotein diacylglycerol transferase
MRPVLFVWRGFKVRSFPVMMYLASLTGMLVTMWAGRSRGLPPERTGAAVLALLCCVFLGARLFYVLMNWKSFSASGWPIFARSQGGMTFSGGLLLGLLVLPPILSSLQLPLAQFCDATGLGMLAGLPVAKAGCFLHGCCCGRPTASWIGVDLPDHNGVWARRFPTQFLELAWSASLFLLLVQIPLTALAPGLLFCLALACYLAPRYLFHKLRPHAKGSAGALARSILGLSIALVTGYLFWLSWSKGAIMR